MDIILFVSGLILCLIGITGSVVPVIPGPFISWLAILIINLTDAVEFNLKRPSFQEGFFIFGA